MLDGAYFTQLLGDEIVAKSFMPPIAQPGVVEAQIRRLGGFDIFETVILPENGEKLVGFAAHPSGLAVAMRYLEPVAEYDEAGAVTDPETGLTFGYLRYTECTARKRSPTNAERSPHSGRSRKPEQPHLRHGRMPLRLEAGHRRRHQAHREAVTRTEPHSVVASPAAGNGSGAFRFAVLVRVARANYQRMMPRKSPPAPVVLGATLVPEIRDLVQQSREYVAATANLALVWLYWNVGRLITIDIQKNARRANYGDELMSSLAQQLSDQLGRGFSAPNLWDMKRFHGAVRDSPDSV